MARVRGLHASEACIATQAVRAWPQKQLCGMQEPPLDAGPTVDDNIRPALQRIQDMLREYEQACTFRAKTCILLSARFTIQGISNVGCIRRSAQGSQKKEQTLTN